MMISMIAAFLQLTLLAKPMDLCEAIGRATDSPTPALTRVVAVLAVGERVVLTPAKEAGRKGPDDSIACVAWLDGELPDEVRRKIVATPEPLTTSYFVVELEGQVDRKIGFKRAQVPPYPGNGFGPNGTYEHRIKVARWINIKPRSR